MRVEEWEVQTIGCKIGSRMHCTTRGIESIFYNNCKWKVTFENCIKFLKIKNKKLYSIKKIVSGLFPVISTTSLSYSLT